MEKSDKIVVIPILNEIHKQQKEALKFRNGNAQNQISNLFKQYFFSNKQK